MNGESVPKIKLSLPAKTSTNITESFNDIQFTSLQISNLEKYTFVFVYLLFTAIIGLLIWFYSTIEPLNDPDRVYREKELKYRRTKRNVIIAILVLVAIISFFWFIRKMRKISQLNTYLDEAQLKYPELLQKTLDKLSKWIDERISIERLGEKATQQIGQRLSRWFSAPN